MLILLKFYYIIVVVKNLFRSVMKKLLFQKMFLLCLSFAPVYGGNEEIKVYISELAGILQNNQPGTTAESKEIVKLDLDIAQSIVDDWKSARSQEMYADQDENSGLREEAEKEERKGAKDFLNLLNTSECVTQDIYDTFICDNLNKDPEFKPRSKNFLNYYMYTLNKYVDRDNGLMEKVLQKEGKSLEHCMEQLLKNKELKNEDLIQLIQDAPRLAIIGLLNMLSDDQKKAKDELFQIAKNIPPLYSILKNHPNFTEFSFDEDKGGEDFIAKPSSHTVCETNESDKKESKAEVNDSELQASSSAYSSVAADNSKDKSSSNNQNIANNPFILSDIQFVDKSQNKDSRRDHSMPSPQVNQEEQERAHLINEYLNEADAQDIGTFFLLSKEGQAAILASFKNQKSTAMNLSKQSNVTQKTFLPKTSISITKENAMEEAENYEFDQLNRDITLLSKERAFRPIQIKEKLQELLNLKIFFELDGCADILNIEIKGAEQDLITRLNEAVGGDESALIKRLIGIKVNRALDAESLVSGLTAQDFILLKDIITQLEGKAAEKNQVFFGTSNQDTKMPTKTTSKHTIKANNLEPLNLAQDSEWMGNMKNYISYVEDNLNVLDELRLDGLRQSMLCLNEISLSFFLKELGEKKLLSITENIRTEYANSQRFFQGDEIKKVQKLLNLSEEQYKSIDPNDFNQLKKAKIAALELEKQKMKNPLIMVESHHILSSTSAKNPLVDEDQDNPIKPVQQDSIQKKLPKGALKKGDTNKKKKTVTIQVQINQQESTKGEEEFGLGHTNTQGDSLKTPSRANEEDQK
jgi:hypothetical protein